MQFGHSQHNFFKSSQNGFILQRPSSDNARVMQFMLLQYFGTNAEKAFGQREETSNCVF